MPLLFEYGEWQGIKGKDALIPMLRNIWEQRLFDDGETELDDEKKDDRYQPFIKLDGDEIRANNYVGFIQNGEEVIEIYPKVFRTQFSNPTQSQKVLMLRHVFYWFSYCRKWRFPFNKASLNTIDIDKFPELLINIIASQFLEIVSQHPHTMYQHLEEALETPRGSINFKRYVSNSLLYGNFHRIECDYEPFLFDNKVNRIIKYCSRLLMRQTKYSESLRMLQEVIFILDEVEDIPCTVHDVEKVTLNSFYQEYSVLMDYCSLILSKQIYSTNSDDLSQWCLLFPMEYIFEDFFAGFLEENFYSDWKVEYQKSDKYLSDKPKAFNMQHDIFLTDRNNPQRKIIVDTKYKLRDMNFKTDLKKGIAQNDLYQMVSYAFKRGCTDIMLIYPNISENSHEPDKFEIVSGFDQQEKIKVTAMEIPFWSLTKNFKELEDSLIKCVAQNINGRAKLKYN